MNCEQFDKTLDDYLDGEAGDPSAFVAHAASCAGCAAALDEARRLQASLVKLAQREAPVDPAFLHTAMSNAASAAGRNRRRRDWLRGFGSAVAACAALFAVFLFFTGSDEPLPDAPNIPSIAMTLEEPRTVNLVFASAEALDAATLTVMLPEGVALAGFEGQREVTWMTSLSAGRNVLPLTLIATTPVGGELLATLKHGADDKAFRIQLTIA